METLQTNLHRERMFLFLSLLVITIFLISSPSNLDSTFSFLTGAAASEITGSSNSYLIGIIISMIALISITLFFHVRRKSPLPAINLPEEEKTAIHSLKTKAPLNEKLDRINMEIQDLRKEGAPLPPNIPKKKNRIVNVKERELKRELDTVNSELQGYSKPTVINAPKREEKFKSSLSYVEQKLSELPEANLKKVKVMESLSSTRKVMETVEKRRMKEELKNLSKALSRGEKDPSSFLQRFPWKARKKKTVLKNISEDLKKELPKSELQEVEEKLAKVRKELSK